MAGHGMLRPFSNSPVFIMDSLLISLLTLALLLISGFIILIVLMQRTSQSGGMGGALGGGAAESAFGSETNSILMKGTVYGIVAFFIVALGLYLLYQSSSTDQVQDVNMETLITAGEEEGGAETTTEVNAVETNSTDGTEEVEAGSISENTEATEAEEGAGSTDAETAEPLPARN